MRGKGWGRGRGQGADSFRLTSARETILNILVKYHKHLTADEIFMLAKRMQIRIGLATVYRTLDLLVSNGLVDKVDVGDGMSRYVAVNVENVDINYFLICKNCREMQKVDVSDKDRENIEQLVMKFEKEYAFSTHPNQINFYGICKKCL